MEPQDYRIISCGQVSASRMYTSERYPGFTKTRKSKKAKPYTSEDCSTLSASLYVNDFNDVTSSCASYYETGTRQGLQDRWCANSANREPPTNPIHHSAKRYPMTKIKEINRGEEGGAGGGAEQIMFKARHQALPCFQCNGSTC